MDGTVISSPAWSQQWSYHEVGEAVGFNEGIYRIEQKSRRRDIRAEVRSELGHFRPYTPSLGH